MILVIDNYDSFTWNLIDYIERHGEKVEVVRNDVNPDDLDLSRYNGIVLSPGPGKPEDSGNLLPLIERCHIALPILGICLGHQALGQFFGAELVKASFPMHEKISSVSCKTSDPVFRNIPQVFNVVRYHSLILRNLPDCLEAIADASGELMAFAHKTLPLYGIQFHPEAYLTEYGERITGNWIEICRSRGVE